MAGTKWTNNELGQESQIWAWKHREHLETQDTGCSLGAGTGGRSWGVDTWGRSGSAHSWGRSGSVDARERSGCVDARGRSVSSWTGAASGVDFVSSWTGAGFPGGVGWWSLWISSTSRFTSFKKRTRLISSIREKLHVGRSQLIMSSSSPSRKQTQSEASIQLTWLVSSRNSSTYLSRQETWGRTHYK